MEIGAVLSTCACCGSAGHEKAMCRFRMRSVAIVARLDISERCADNVRNLLASQVPRPAVARVLAKAVRAVEAQTDAIVVDRSVIDDLTALVETRVAASVARKEKFNTCGHCQSMILLDSRWTLCLFATTPISRLTNLVTC